MVPCTFEQDPKPAQEPPWRPWRFGGYSGLFSGVNDPKESIAVNSSDDIRDYVQDLPILDVHEHHMPETLLDRNVGLLQLLDQSYAGWTRQRPYPLSTDVEPPEPMLERQGTGEWSDVRAYLEHHGSSMFVRNMLDALSELYDLGDDGITEGNWQSLDEEIRRRHADPAWVPDVLDRAGVQHIVTDPYVDPLMDARSTLGDRYSSVLRINAFAMGWHPDSRDHNGNSAHEFAERLGVKIDTFADYVDLLPRVLDTMPDRHQVALKNALAYDRTINFDPNPDDGDGRRCEAIFGRSNPGSPERKTFGDFIVNELCRLAGERDIPVQMHIGSALIRGSRPLNVAGLLERHPKTRFLLMHLGYPWSGELLGLAFVYRNVWIDLTWSWLLSPTRFRHAFHEAIEVLPDESRMMLGGDNWHVEETYGTLARVRQLVGDALAEKVDAGYFRPDDARRLARKIFHDNAIDFFGLEP